MLVLFAGFEIFPFKKFKDYNRSGFEFFLENFEFTVESFDEKDMVHVIQTNKAFMEW